MKEPIGLKYTKFDQIPRGCFEVIAADPPWRFLTRTAAGEGRSPQSKYNTMSLSEIRALPMREIAARDCILFLWAWSPMLVDAVRLLEDWRFDFVTSGAWAKRSETGRHWAMGNGYYLRGACEYFLIGKRGNPKVRDKSVRNLFAPPDPRDLEPIDGGEGGDCHSPDSLEDLVDGPLIIDRVRDHSQKPDCALAPIEVAFAGPRIELFARTPRPGWSAFGDQVDTYAPISGQASGGEA